MSNRYPEESFNIREAIEGDSYKIMMVNESLKNFHNKNSFQWALIIIIDLKFKIVGSNLPTDDEAVILNNLEEQFNLLINNVAEYQFIGRITGDGMRELYYFIDHPKEVNNQLSTLISEGNFEREFEYSLFHDPNWQSVDFFFDY